MEFVLLESVDMNHLSEVLGRNGIFVDSDELKKMWMHQGQNYRTDADPHLCQTLTNSFRSSSTILGFVKNLVGDDKYREIKDKYATSENLTTEYYNWERVNRFLVASRGKLQSKKKLYEVDNILCRFLLTWHNYPEKRKNATTKALSELKEKDLAWVRLQTKILDGANSHNFDPNDSTMNIYFVNKLNDSVTIQVKDFESTIPLSTYYKLLGDASVTSIIKMLLRYESVMCRTGQFWGLPKKTWDLLRSEYLVEYEGFACPLNSNLKKFYSLFIDSDQVFGSQGNFLEASLGSGVYAVNPPYIESLLQGSSDQILKVLDDCPNVTVFSLVPGWDDSIGIQCLLKSPYLKHQINLSKGHIIQDYLNNKPMTAYFTNYFLILSNNEQTFNVEEIEKTFH